MTQKLPQICTVIFVSVLGRLRDLQYIFAVTSGSPSISNHVQKDEEDGEKVARKVFSAPPPDRVRMGEGGKTNK